MPVVNMWCAQTMNDRMAIERWRTPSRCSRTAACGEGRHDLADDAEGRQDHDVHLGVAEEPEDVLVHHRVAAAGGLKKLVPKWRSVSVMVMAPASTGITAISRR
jgi:hypothetical protein